MKRFWVLPVSVFLFASCKETPPAVDLTPPAADTSFMAAVETPQDRVVLIEEFTGVTCPTCPPGHKVIDAMETANPGRLAVMGIQLFGNAQTQPYDHDGKKTINDNRTLDGTDLGNGIYGTTSSIPVAAFDRFPQNGVIRPIRTQWVSYLPSRLAAATKANLSVTSSFDAGSKTATIKVHIAYTQDVARTQMLTLALVENDVVDAQELPTGDTAPVALNYVHQHVFRDAITAPTGSPILTNLNNKPAGLVYERTIKYTIPNTVLNPDNCRIIAFVSNSDGADIEVQQAAEIHLK
jgi:hypothetical protein